MTRELNLLVNTKPGKDNLHSIESKLSRDELFILFDYCIGNMPQSPNKFTRMLKHKRIETQRMRMDNGENAYGMHITWIASKEFCNEHRPEKISMRRVK